MTAGLTVRDLVTGYGRMEVVRGLDLEVRPGELVALLGRNGAGKTTALTAIAGLRPHETRGDVTLGERSLRGVAPPQVYELGLALVPEGHRLFPSLTVAENLRLGGYPHRRRRDGAASERLAYVYHLFPILADFARREAGHLSGGQQQMVSIGQALMGGPDVLLLDEPSSGLAPVVVDNIYSALASLRADGKALLVVEQNVERALGAADRAYVLERGHIALAGTARELAADQRVPDIVRGTAVVQE